MANKNISKVVFGSEVLIDLTADTVTADKILTGFTAHDNAGNVITGTCGYDVNSQDATVQVAEILTGKSAYARGTKLVGTMPNNGSVTLTISDVNDEVSIAQGYHDGSGKVGILDTEKAKIIAANIKQGVSVLGVTGNLRPIETALTQEKTVTPSADRQVVLPDEGYDYVSKVTVNAIPYSETVNAAGGLTVTIGG